MITSRVAAPTEKGLSLARDRSHRRGGNPGGAVRIGPGRRRHRRKGSAHPAAHAAALGGPDEVILGFLPGTRHLLVVVPPAPVLGVLEVGVDVANADDQKYQAQQRLPPGGQYSEAHAAHHDQNDAPRNRIVQKAKVVQEHLVVEFRPQQQNTEESQVPAQDELGGVDQGHPEQAQGKGKSLPDYRGTSRGYGRPPQETGDFLERPKQVSRLLVAVPRVGTEAGIAPHLGEVGVGVVVRVGFVTSRSSSRMRRAAAARLVRKEGCRQSVVLGGFARHVGSGTFVPLVLLILLVFAHRNGFLL
mmetsp:Transcript_25593/g.54652  ORF Transcript_25593/g.54652 Transcript_25593/m.54652 type:complete len:302 (+) Transcript_25593:243-1148(+)